MFNNVLNTTTNESIYATLYNYTYIIQITNQLKHILNKASEMLMLWTNYVKKRTVKQKKT